MDTITQSEKRKACAKCGAELLYKPGSDQLRCEYCGYEAYIEPARKSFEELELEHYLDLTGNHVHTDTIDLLHCENCGANQHVQERYKSLSCGYCGEPLIREDVFREGWIQPGAVAPFELDHDKARAIFRTWVRKLWFAPGKLKRAALDPEGMHGLYLPYWTFDARMAARYSGQRGDYYYETERYRTEKGMQTRQVRKTRWRPASGEVSGFVDDILIPASHRKADPLPSGVSHWNLKALKPFQTDYLAGYTTEKYTLSLKDGHQQSFAKAREIAHTWIRRDIGGDEQRILQADIRLSGETFKHILLPVYISSYKYRGRDYRFYINGQTGSIHGSRPYSAWKIILFVLAIFAGIALISLLAK
ncbi:DNA helicase PriA [Robiginitalea sediminis]|uniref:DNA helicase PriA n=1 Tax=Robiginitalea sediminis TaxID=1982593 RepID=UPI000B4B5493|nr:DNA helicase PriA [Robiginitalea sediminis]